MIDDEDVTVSGVILAVRGPSLEGSYELEIEQEDGVVVLVTLSAEQYFMAQDYEEIKPKVERQYAVN